MRFVFLVALREYVENAKTKGFWIGMFMLPLMIFASVKVSVLLETKAAPVRHYVLIDQSGQFAPVIQSRLKKSKKFLAVPAPEGMDTNADLSALAGALKPYLRGKQNITTTNGPVELYAAILIPRDIEKQIVRPGYAPVGTNGIEYWSANLADTSLRDDVEQAVNKEVRRREYMAKGVDVNVVRQVEQTYAPLASLSPAKKAGHETVNQTDVVQEWAPSAFVYLLWVAIFGIIQMLLNNVIEEKSNRIIEVLLSSVTPGELMMGKLFGIAAVGLTMISVWMAALFGALILPGGEPGVTGMLLHLLRTTPLVPLFAFYFLLGYLMYAAFILALGSVCNTLKEAQNYMGIIVMTLMVPLLTLPVIPRDPNGTLARVLSWIPIYTPFTMMNRANANPPLVDFIGTALLLLASTAGAIWMSGKIFRIGVLRTGQPPKIIEILRWLKS